MKRQISNTKNDRILYIPKIQYIQKIAGSIGFSAAEASLQNACCILFICKGAAYCYDGEERSLLSAGELLVKNSGKITAVTPAQSESLSAWICIASDVHYSGLPENYLFSLRKTNVIKTLTFQEELEASFSIIKKEYESGEGYDSEFARAELIKLFYLILKIADRQGITRIYAPFEAGVYTKGYIDMHFREKITLTSLARQMNVSTYYLTHEMKRLFGISAINYLIDCRMKETKRLLLETNMRIIDIAHEVGYEHISHFINLFHRREGLTPQQYRKKHRC